MRSRRPVRDRKVAEQVAVAAQRLAEFPPQHIVVGLRMRWWSNLMLILGAVAVLVGLALFSAALVAGNYPHSISGKSIAGFAAFVAATAVGSVMWQGAYLLSRVTLVMSNNTVLQFARARREPHAELNGGPFTVSVDRSRMPRMDLLDGNGRIVLRLLQPKSYSADAELVDRHRTLVPAPFPLDRVIERNRRGDR